MDALGRPLALSPEQQLNLDGGSGAALRGSLVGGGSDVARGGATDDGGSVRSFWRAESSENGDEVHSGGSSSASDNGARAARTGDLSSALGPAGDSADAAAGGAATGTASTRASGAPNAVAVSAREAECVALLRDSTPSSPAHPASLAACQPVLDAMVSRQPLGPGQLGRPLSSPFKAIGDSVPGGRLRLPSGGVVGGGGGGGLGAAAGAPSDAGLGLFAPPPPGGKDGPGDAAAAHAAAFASPLDEYLRTGSSGGGVGVGAGASSAGLDAGTAGSGAFGSAFGLSADRLARLAGAPPVAVATLRNEAERCGLTPNTLAPPMLLWRAKRVGGSTLAALLVRFAFVHHLVVAGPQGRMAHKACQAQQWAAGQARRSAFNASVSHWPFTCRPHEQGRAWGGLSHLFGGRTNFKEVREW